MSDRRSDDRPRRRTQPERIAESSKRLLDAAIDLIGSQGYSQTTAIQIGVHAGYSREMVRVRYGSMDELVEQVLALPFENRLTGEVGLGLTGHEQVAARLEVLREINAQSPRLMRAFCLISFAVLDGAQPLQPHMDRWLQRVEVLLAEAIADGVRDGSVRGGVEPAAEARWIVRGIVGCAYDWLLSGDESFDPLLEDLTARTLRHLAV